MPSSAPYINNPPSAGPNLGWYRGSVGGGETLAYAPLPNRGVIPFNPFQGNAPVDPAITANWNATGQFLQGIAQSAYQAIANPQPVQRPGTSFGGGESAAYARAGMPQPQLSPNQYGGSQLGTYGPPAPVGNHIFPSVNGVGDSPAARLNMILQQGTADVYVGAPTGEAINAMLVQNGLQPIYDYTGRLKPEFSGAANGQGVSPQDTQNGWQIQRDQNGRPYASTQQGFDQNRPGDYARINSDIRGSAWEVRTVQDSQGNWVRVTEAARGRRGRGGGGRAAQGLSGSGESGGPGGPGGGSVPDFGLVNMNAKWNV